MELGDEGSSSGGGAELEEDLSGRGEGKRAC